MQIGQIRRSIWFDSWFAQFAQQARDLLWKLNWFKERIRRILWIYMSIYLPNSHKLGKYILVYLSDLLSKSMIDVLKLLDLLDSHERWIQFTQFDLPDSLDSLQFAWFILQIFRIRTCLLLSWSNETSSEILYFLIGRLRFWSMAELVESWTGQKRPGHPLARATLGDRPGCHWLG